MFASNHSPETIPQTGGVPHGTRRSVPRLVDRIHIADPDVDEVVESGVVEGHVISPTVELVLMERYQTPVIDEVVNGQLLLEDVPKVLLGVFQPEQGRVDDL